MLIEAWGVSKTFKGGRAAFGGGEEAVRALRGVSLQIREGESVGLVGESGGGKSTLLKILLGLETPDSGLVFVDGVSLAGTPSPLRGARRFAPRQGEGRERVPRPAMLSVFRRNVGLVLQDPYTSLDPVWPVWRIVTEPLAASRKIGKAERKAKAVELLESVGLSSQDLDLNPESFSGGQRQRLALARALSSDPKILFLDEPVSSLDVSVQAQILELLAKIRREKSLSYFVISHDLPTVGTLCDRIYVLYQGRIIEEGPANQILNKPAHPYTAGLIQSRPLSEKKDCLPTADPGPIPPRGCGYAPRCPKATELCVRLDPPLFGLEHRVSCLFPLV